MKQKRKMLAVLTVAAAILLVLAAVLGRPEEAEQTEEAAPLLGLSREEISAIGYQYRREENLLTMEGDGWVLNEQPEITLIQDVPDTMADQLAGLTVKRDLGNVDDPAEYGLDDPDLTVTVQGAVLLLGDINPVTGDVYLMMQGDDHVYTADQAVKNSFCYTAEELYSPQTVVSFSQDDLIGFCIESKIGGETVWQFEQTEDGWRLADQPELALKQSAVGSLLSHAAATKSNWICPGADPAEYGLDSPDLRLVLETAEGETEYCVSLPDGEENGWLLDGKTGNVYRIAQSDALTWIPDMEKLTEVP